jgi:hypothetical protein
MRQKTPFRCTLTLTSTSRGAGEGRFRNGMVVGNEHHQFLPSAMK